MQTPMELITIREAARLLSMSPGTLYQLANQGKIPAAKIGGLWRVNKTALLANLLPAETVAYAIPKPSPTG